MASGLQAQPCPTCHGTGQLVEPVLAGWKLNDLNQLIGPEGRAVHIPPLHARLLAHLLYRQNTVVPYAAVQEWLWEVEDKTLNSLLKVHVSNLRRQFEEERIPWNIITVRQTGYMLKERRLAGAERI